jgi:hypothetical protein
MRGKENVYGLGNVTRGGELGYGVCWGREASARSKIPAKQLCVHHVYVRDGKTEPYDLLNIASR